MGSTKYDIILIEPSYWHMSHSENDIQCLAEIFCFLGYQVAVATIIKTAFHEGHEYSVIDIPKGENFPDIDYTDTETIKFKRFFKKIILDFRRYSYFKRVFNDIEHLADNFYIGILTVDLLPILISLRSPGKRYFLWGFRSYYLSKPFVFSNKNPYTIAKSILLKSIIRNKNKYFLFVSNHFIKKEFEKLGVSSDNILQRPERILKSPPYFNYKKLTTEFSLVSIGSLRPIKHIEFAINVIREMDILYTIAGKSTNRYAYSIDKQIASLTEDNIKRVKGYLSDDQYVSVIHSAHFVLICDKADLSVASKGTFLDALLNCRPVIAPDCEPFRYYIDKYSIGLKFNNGDTVSLKSTIKEAKRLGVKSFTTNIMKFQNDHLIKNVAQKLEEKISRSLIKK